MISIVLQDVTLRAVVLAKEKFAHCLLQKDDDLVQLFKHLGQYDILEESVYSHLEKFGCLMIGYPTSNEVDTVRCDIVKNRFTQLDDHPLDNSALIRRNAL